MLPFVIFFPPTAFKLQMKLKGTEIEVRQAVVLNFSSLFSHESVGLINVLTTLKEGAPWLEFLVIVDFFAPLYRKVEGHLV